MGTQCPERQTATPLYKTLIFFLLDSMLGLLRFLNSHHRSRPFTLPLIYLGSSRIAACSTIGASVSAVHTTLDIPRFIPHSRLLDYRCIGLGRSHYP